MKIKGYRLVFRQILLVFALFICGVKGISQEQPLIFPIPQQVHLENSFFSLDETVQIVIPLSQGPKTLTLARLLVKELSDRYGLALHIINSNTIPQDTKSIIMGTVSNPLIKSYINKNHLLLSERNPGREGYVLNINTKNIVVAGSDNAGAFYGLQSLRQLIEKGKGKQVQALLVRDWPRLPFRGIRLYVPGPDNRAFFKRFVNDFMALYKFNKLIIEFNCMRLDKHPEINAGWIDFAKDMEYSRTGEPYGPNGELKNSTHYDAGDGSIIEKQEVREIVKNAEDNFIEVVPEIPSLTHGYALLKRHPELAEYPGDPLPDTYCPSNPASYKLMFDVYDEYISVIHPKMIQIGHDEWWGAPLGVCPICRNKDYSTLYAQDVNHIYHYLNNKKIKVAMWGDFLLESVWGKGPQERISATGIKYKTPGGLEPSIVRKLIPKDILIFNWSWEDDEQKEKEYQSFGFKQIFGNFEPTITNWDTRIKKIDVLGGEVSSWAATTEFNIGKDLLMNFLGCANLLWSNYAIDSVYLPKIIRQLVPSVHSRLSLQKVPSNDGDSVISIDINTQVNLNTDSLPFGVNLSTLKKGELKYSSKVFKLADGVIGIGCIGVGATPLPSHLNGIPINEDVSSLIFLQSCAHMAGNQKSYYNIPDNFDAADLIGWYEIVYEDSFKVIVPIQYGVNILEWNPGGKKIMKENDQTNWKSAQSDYCYAADPVNCSKDPANHPITFYSFEWVNPRFGKIISHVNIYGSVRYGTLQRQFVRPVTEPMESNAIFLIGISKVVKRKPIGIMGLEK